MSDKRNTEWAKSDLKTIASQGFVESDDRTIQHNILIAALGLADRYVMNLSHVLATDTLFNFQDFTYVGVVPGAKWQTGYQDVDFVAITAIADANYTGDIACRYGFEHITGQNGSIAPTAAIGHPIKSNETIVIRGRENILNLRMFRAESNDCNLYASFGTNKPI